MDLLQELYDAHAHSAETETALTENNKELVEFLDSNVLQEERPTFLNTIESIIKGREQYFFQIGFNSAKQLLMK